MVITNSQEHGYHGNTKVNRQAIFLVPPLGLPKTLSYVDVLDRFLNHEAPGTFDYLGSGLGWHLLYQLKQTRCLYLNMIYFGFNKQIDIP